MRKIITVDFDETLAETIPSAWGGSSLVPIRRIIDFVKEQHNKGVEIHIVTFRGWDSKKEVENFCRLHRVPVKSIVCTEGKNKAPFIQKLNSKLHVDDSVEVCTLCIMAGIDVLLVDHGQETHNTTAKWIPKI
jgi:pyruvate-formate lyase-activating enzyme